MLVIFKFIKLHLYNTNLLYYVLNFISIEPRFLKYLTLSHPVVECDNNSYNDLIYPPYISKLIFIPIHSTKRKKEAFLLLFIVYNLIC